ncbi:MAG: XrtV sorting system accessory protein [Polymorphobacter sp.]
MQTVYDWGTMIVFAGLIVLFLQRSQGEPRDYLWQYLVAAVGCAGTNYLGNEGIKLESVAYHAAAIAAGLATLAFIFIVLRPLDGFNE